MLFHNSISRVIFIESCNRIKCFSVFSVMFYKQLYQCMSLPRSDGKIYNVYFNIRVMLRNKACTIVILHIRRYASQPLCVFKPVR